jgi:hypothetical protein
MKLATLIFLLISVTTLSSQNLSGDFTANDFLKRKSTKLKFLATTVDSVTKKQTTKTTLTAIYNPKTKIITIQDVDTKYKHYVLTDCKNELHTVDANGKEDTVNFLPCRALRLNDTTFKECDFISVYNKKGQLIKSVTDTNSTTAMTLIENCYYYSGDTLKRSVSKTFIFYPGFTANKYDPNEPEQVTETFFNGDQEHSTTKVLKRPSKTITTSKTVTENRPKTITSKTYYNDKLTFIGTYVFE